VGTAHEYLRAIMARNREFMEPVGFKPNWADHPRRHKFYADVEYIPLPAGPADDGATLQDGLYGTAGSEGQLTLALLADMLQDSYGQLGRRLSPNANSDVPNLPRYSDAKWNRGTASGGGIYPVSVYWVAGPSGPVLPGVYFYNPAQHTLQRLITGDVSAEVRAAIGDPTISEDTDQFLVLGLKWWQNAFKYNSFTFHAVTMDAFGHCLREKGATFYGASWCPHCRNQRATLGDAMSSVKYVECSVDGHGGGTWIAHGSVTTSVVGRSGVAAGWNHRNHNRPRGCPAVETQLGWPGSRAATTIIHEPSSSYCTWPPLIVTRS